MVLEEEGAVGAGDKADVFVAAAGGLASEVRLLIAFALIVVW